MQIKQLLIISILLGVLMGACKTKVYQSPKISQAKEVVDTLYFGYKYMEKMRVECQPMSYKQAGQYMKRAHYVATDVFIDFDTMSYKKIYVSDTFFLGNATWGKFIFFENETKQWYNSVQLYLLNEKGKTKDILEIIATFDDAGTRLDCTSLLFLDKSRGYSIVFTRIYNLQRMFEDTNDGGWRDISYLKDTIIAHQFKNGRKYPFKIPSKKQKELQRLFIESY